MEEIIMQFVESFKGNFWEIVLAGSFIVQLITGNKTEAQKTARYLAKHTKALNKYVKKAEKEQSKIKEIEEKNASNKNE